MKRVLNYKTFINESSEENRLTQKQIDFLNRYVTGKWNLNDDGSVDVVGDFDCFNVGTSDFKEISFGKISGNFDCSYNNLTTLEDCPKDVNGDLIIMKRILNYKTFINESSGESTLNAEQIDFLNNYVSGKWYLNDEGFVDVDGDFKCFNKGVSDFKGIKFGKVEGDFDCSFNKLISLKGSPKEVDGDFDCHYNSLISLEFGPKKVGGIFNCSNTNITSLEFSPKEVGGGFNCSANDITSLEYAPKKIRGNFICSHNKLTSLEFAPKEVGGGFNCTFNKLTSLEFVPKKVGGNFNCSYNDLTSLEFAPERVGGSFYCSNNSLTSLEGAPKEVDRIVYLVHNEGVSSEILKLIFSKMLESKLEYSDALKSLWVEIPIEDKIILYTPDLDWVEEDEASKLVKLKRYNSIKKMI